MKYLTLLLITITTLFSNSYSQWIGNANLPYYFSKVMFINSNTGFIGGGSWADTSIIYKTTDAGITWSITHTDTLGPIRDISFCNIDTGFAVGFKGSILKTTNGGSFWSNIFLIDTIHFTNITCPSKDTCFATGSYLYRTIDGGLSWQISYNEMISKVEFPTSLIGYGLGYNKLIKTTNGGNSWSILNSNGNHDISFVNSMIGYTILHQTIRKTTDGGLTWENFSPFLIDSIGFYNSLHALTENYVFAACTSSFGLIVVKTFNGGITWQLQHQALDNSTNQDIFFLDSLNGWLVGWPYGLFNVYKTSNGGIGNSIQEVNFYDDQVIIYPNPANNEVDIINIDNALIRVIDMNGNMVFMKENVKNGYHLNLEEMQSGIYLISITSRNITKNVKILKL